MIKLIRDEDMNTRMRFVVFRAQEAMNSMTTSRVAEMRIYVKSLTTLGIYIDKSTHLPLSKELTTSIANAVSVFEAAQGNLRTSANITWLTSLAVGVSRKVRKEIQPYVPAQFLPKIETGAGYHEDASLFKNELAERSLDLSGLVCAKTRQVTDFGKKVLANVSIISAMLEANSDATISSPVCAEIRAFYDLIEEGNLNLASADLENLFNRTQAIITALVDVEGFSIPDIIISTTSSSGAGRNIKRSPSPTKVNPARPHAPENAAIH